MSEPQATASLTQHVRPIEAGAHVIAAAFLDGAPALALADGVVLLGEPDEQKRVVAHPDATILTAVGDGRTLMTGGDDGRVVALRADGEAQQIADEKGRWIDALALRGNACAWSAGKQVSARDEAGAVKTWSAPSTVRGLAFQPKGYRLAATHYNGATLWFPKVEGAPTDPGVEGRASRCNLFSRRAISRHLDAGECAARLAPSGFAPHAHDRIPGQDALALLVA